MEEFDALVGKRQQRVALAAIVFAYGLINQARDTAAAVLGG